jgi:general secretion pathway protein M
MDTLRAAWQARTSRERTVLAFGGASVAALLLFGFVWEPLRIEHKRLRASVPQLRAHAERFAADAKEAARLQDVGLTTKRHSSPRTAVEAVAEQAGIRARIKSVTEVAEGRLQVALDPLPYDVLVRWVGALATGANLAVESVELRRGPATGTVQVEMLVLKAAGAL